MPLILPGNVASATAPTTYDVANSCRWNRADEPYLAKTPTSTGSQTKYTLSVWFKIGNTESSARRDIIYAAYAGNLSRYSGIVINDARVMEVFAGTYNGGTSTSLDYSYITTQTFQDPSAWYHLVLGVDTTDGVAADRVKIWINNTRITDFSTTDHASSSGTSYYNYVDIPITIGAQSFVSGDPSNWWDGYMAEVYWIDGTRYAPTDFGEYDEDSPTIWKPIDASGLTFGTNGFYLDFEASGNLGNDVNGGTDLTEVNLDATDQATDSPTNNFCTLNPLSMYHSNTPTLAQGNCRFSSVAASGYGATGTMGVSSGKWYFEMKKVSQDSGPDDDSQRNVFGITAKPYQQQATHPDPETWMLLGNSAISNNSVEIASVGPSMLSDGGILQCALDLDNNRVAFGHDDAWQTGSSAFSGSYSDYESITAAASTISGFYFPIIGDNSSTRGYTMDANFGGCPAMTISSAQSDENGYGTFEFAPPSGFLAMCTKNLGSDGG